MMRKPIKTMENDALYNEEHGENKYITEKIEPAKFSMCDKVVVTTDIDVDGVNVSKGLELTIMGVKDDDMYDVVGPNGLSVCLHGSYLEKMEGGVTWGIL